MSRDLADPTADLGARVVRHALAALLGAGVVGAALLVSTSPGQDGAAELGLNPQEVPQTALHPSLPPAAAPQCAAQLQERDALRAEIIVLQSRLERAERRAERAQEERAAIQGEPIPFPEDLPRPFQAAHFAHALEEALEAHEGYALLEADCSEYPCMAIVAAENPVGREIPDLFKGWAADAGYEIGQYREGLLSQRHLAEPWGDGAPWLRLFLVGPEGSEAILERSGERMSRRYDELQGR